MTLLFLLGCAERGSAVQARFVRNGEALTPMLRLDLAATPSQREQGLMYRKSMEPDAGMLFLFPSESSRAFWMRNTYLELDIIFLNQEKRVINVVERAAPLTDTPRKSLAPALYVVELLGGQSGKWGVKAGDVLEVSGALPTPK